MSEELQFSAQHIQNKFDLIAGCDGEYNHFCFYFYDIGWYSMN